MIGRILGFVLPVVALLGGAAAGDLLRGKPAPEASTESQDNEGRAPAAPAAEAASDAEMAWFRFPQQFLVPLVRDGELQATMILSVSLEVPQAASEEIFAREFKLRDALLREMLIHANTGGFDGNFTADARVEALRGRLLAAAQVVDPRVSAVLIGDIARQ